MKKLTQHKNGFEDGEHCSDHDAVLRGCQKVAVTGRPDADWTFVC